MENSQTSALLQGQQPLDTIVHRDLAYAPEGQTRQTLDLYLPGAGGRFPLIIWIHGDQDPLVPHHQSVLLTRALEQAGVPVTFHTVKQGGHGGFTDPKVPKLTGQFIARHVGE